MEWRLFADLADIAGDRLIEIQVGDDATVNDALAALLAERPPLSDRVYDESGDLYEHLNILKNGADISTDDGLATPVNDDDELALFPPVSGG